MSDSQEVYRGDEQLSFDSNVGKLKDVFLNLLPEILQKGRQGEFTTLKEAFPCVRAAQQTNPALLAQAKIQDQETLNRLSFAQEAFDFFTSCFQANLINKAHASRDEQDAFMTYDLLHSQMLVIRQAIRTEQSHKQCKVAIENLSRVQCSAKVHYNLSKFRSTKEPIYQENIELAYQQFEEAKDHYLVSLNGFSDECKKLALIRQRPYDVNQSKYAFLNDLLWKRSTRLMDPSNDPCSIDDYFAKQDMMWSDALQGLTTVAAPTPQVPQLPVQMSPARTNQSRSQFETRKFNLNRVALGRMLEELTQEMGKMRVEELKFSLKELQSRHKVVEDLSMDPDVTVGDTTVLVESKKLMRSLVVKIESKVKEDKDSDERRKHEANANLKALGTVSLPNLTGFSDYLPWKKAQEKLNTHVDDFKKAAVLLGTLKNPDDKARCQGIYDFDELMNILKTKYSHQEKLVPALINKLRKLPEPHSDEVMQRNIDVILNVYSQLKSISNVAISRFDATVVEDMILKLTPRYQERYEDFIEDNKSKAEFAVFRFGEEDSVIETIISGGDQEEDRAPVDTSDTSTKKRNMFLTFLKRTEIKLANMAARKVNLSSSSGGQRFQKCTKCKTKPCKCKKQSSSAYSAQVASEKTCPVCNTITPHLNRNRKPTKSLQACKEFRNKTLADRKNIVRKTKACVLCLGLNHFVKDCKREYKCNNCQGKHNILLCSKKTSSTNSTPSAPPMEQIDADSNFVKSASRGSYLAVSGAVAIDCKNKINSELTCLWDNGSQVNFILDSVAKKLGYTGHPTMINLTTVGSFVRPVKYNRYTIQLRSNTGDLHKVDVYGVPTLGNRPAISSKDLQSFANQFNVKQSEINNRHGQIQILMGIPNLKLHPLRVKRIENVELLKSKFGKPFMVLGSLSGGQNEVSCNFINAEIRDYVTNDSLGLNLSPKCSICLKTPECKQCKLLTQPVSFKDQEEGRLIKDSIDFDYEKKEVRVSYPYLKDPHKIFPPDQSNFKLASKLANNLKNSLSKDDLLNEYSENWDDMINRGVIKELSEDEIESWESSGNPVNYCSHHAVLKDSKSTKCRIVTNSSLAHNGTSLNAILPKGPNSISNLLHVLMRFRSRPYLVIADLSKAYNTVKTSELDCHLRRFLWYKLEDLQNPNPKLRVFGLMRMHFGDTPSGFYLECCKQEVSDYARETLKDEVLADKLISESYVDDILPTCNTLKEAKEISEALPVAFGALGFKMKDVTVNGPGVKLKENKEPEHLLGHLYHFDDDQIEIKFGVNFSKRRRGQKTLPNLTSSSKLDSVPITKRSILSLLASQYDPMGLASPFLVKYKIFQAKLFKNPNYTGWDTPVNHEDQKYGMKLVKEMIYASERGVRFDRCNKPEGFRLKRIVCFSDGSIVAFQTVLYGVYVGPNGKIHTSLLTAKNRVTAERVPRSELCGIVASCRLLLNYIEAVPEASEAEEIQFLSDSTCALDWISDYYTTKEIYVINRVLEIRKSVRLIKIPTRFYWIRSGLNIADKGTKAECKFNYLASDEWQKGPHWIRDLDKSSAQLKHTFNVGAEENLAMAYNVGAEIVPDKCDIWSNLLKTENLQKVLRVWCIVHGIIVKKRFQRKSPTVSDMDRAFKFFVKISQEEKTVEQLKTKQLVIFEKDGILWTKMRFSDEMLKNIFNKEMLPVISPKCKFARLLLRAAHVSSRIHCGIHQTLVNSRVGRYGAYITHGKQAIRGLINSCVVCRKTSKQIQDAKMSVRKGGFGEVPEDGSCFNKIAIDYFGPYMCKPPKGRETRGTKFFKIWGMAVLCQQTRAIKVYPIEGYDAESFLTAFKIHCANHGVPTSVLSDPMTAFVSGAKSLEKQSSLENEVQEGSIQLQLEEQFNLEWTFIPPGSQWRDPAERAIKSIKSMMDAVFSCEKGNPVLTLNEYWCLFSEISEMLNRRPIQGAVFQDSLRMICPNDLILGRTSKEQPVLLPESMNNRKRLQMIQDFKSEFWKVMINIFASDCRLFKYPTWYKQSRIPKLDDIVLVLYKSKLKDNFKIAKVVNVSENGRDLELIVASIQDSSVNNFKLPNRMKVPTQRTILLYSPEDDESCD